MWDSILNIAKSASAFLQTGVAPPNTPIELQKAMQDANHMASKKFFIIMTSLLILVTMFLVAVVILFILPKDHDIVITAYATIFSKIMEQIALVISVYLGAQGLVDLRYNSSSSANISGEAQSVNERENSMNIDEQILTNNTKEADYTTEVQ